MDIARRHVPPLAVASAAIAVFSLTPSVSQAPLVLLLSTVLLQSSINPSAWLQTLTSYTLTLSLASTLARLAPSLTALSTPFISILILVCGSLISTFSTLLPIIFYAAIAPSLSPIPHAFLFPDYVDDVARRHGPFKSFWTISSLVTRTGR
ncbi:hypothetical protein BS47DRAFT_1013115 [Hydnum rufescens UP504]|uniref:Uncharacterized protein n=1 Tax=Hydnum rufescens UP504 TaxID=1448309 RepID=A0A9P6DWR8_9AGAM|nr:hypothetical protein BS47DRAFT_1013115 [Hydnum rufescens UP504]